MYGHYLWLETMEFYMSKLQINVKFMKEVGGMVQTYTTLAFSAAAAGTPGLPPNHFLVALKKER